MDEFWVLHIEFSVERYADKIKPIIKPFILHSYIRASAYLSYLILVYSLKKKEFSRTPKKGSADV